MRRRGLFQLILAAVCLGVGGGAAPATPSFQGVKRTVNEIRQSWAKPGAPRSRMPQDGMPSSMPCWASCATVPRQRARTIASSRSTGCTRCGRARGHAVVAGCGAAGRAAKLAAAAGQARLGRTPAGRQGSRTLGAGQSGGAGEPSALASVRRLGPGTGPPPVRRRDHSCPAAGGFGPGPCRPGRLKEKNTAHPWVPSQTLQAALDDLYNQPNLDISADLATLTPFLSNDVVRNGPIYHKGYTSQVTAGAKTGFGLMSSDNGIAFYNSQMMWSVTPIWDFQQQMASDPRGRRATRMYQFSATTQDYAQLTIVAVLGPNGLQLGPQYQHNVDAIIGSVPQPGRNFARAIASLIGFNQQRITQEVKEGALPKMRQNVAQEAAESRCGEDRPGSGDPERHLLEVPDRVRPAGAGQPADRGAVDAVASRSSAARRCATLARRATRSVPTCRSQAGSPCPRRGSPATSI